MPPEGAFRTWFELTNLLRKNGFKNYRGYLSTEHWKEKRLKVLSRERICACCTSLATAAHHAYYTEDNVIGDSTCGILPICRRCHNAIHSGKRELADVYDVTMRMANSFTPVVKPKKKPKENYALRICLFCDSPTKGPAHLPIPICGKCRGIHRFNQDMRTFVSTLAEFVNAKKVFIANDPGPQRKKKSKYT